MPGLASGLAEGLQAGISLGQRKNEQDFEQQMATRQQARADQDQQLKLSAADRDKATASLGAIQQQKKDLASQIATDPNYSNNKGQYNQAFYKLSDTENELYKHLGGADLTDFANGAQRTADDLQYGRKQISDLSPQEFTNVIAYKTQRPPSDFVDTSQSLSPVGQALQKFHEGMDKMPQDGGAQVLSAFNDLYGHELSGMVDQQTADGKTIVGAEFAPPVPHPGDPNHAMLTAKITTKDAGGKVEERYVPILDDHGKMVADPADHPDAQVKNFNMGQLMHHIGALESTYQAINGHPELRGKAIEGYLNGHEDDANEQIAMIRRLGADPNQWKPKRNLVIDAEGNLKGVYSGTDELKVLPKQPDAAHDALYTAQMGLVGAELKNLQAGLSKDGRAPPAGPSQDETESTAQAIANYDMAPPTGRNAYTPANQAIMQRVRQLNPKYNAPDYEASKHAVDRFDSGKQGDTVRSFNVSVGHLKTLGELADALHNGNVPLFNKISNAVSEQTGHDAPKNFDAAKSIVADEIVKAITGSAGALGDREEAAKTIQAASSPAQLAGVIKTYTELMGSQLKGYRREYEASTKRKDFDEKYLYDDTRSALGEAQPAAGGPGLEAPGAQTVSKALLAQYAQKHGLSEDSARAALTDHGFKVEP